MFTARFVLITNNTHLALVSHKTKFKVEEAKFSKSKDC